MYYATSIDTNPLACQSEIYSSVTKVVIGYASKWETQSPTGQLRQIPSPFPTIISYKVYWPGYGRSRILTGPDPNRRVRPRVTSNCGPECEMGMNIYRLAPAMLLHISHRWINTHPLSLLYMLRRSVASCHSMVARSAVVGNNTEAVGRDSSRCVALLAHPGSIIILYVELNLHHNQHRLTPATIPVIHSSAILSATSTSDSTSRLGGRRRSWLWGS